MAYPASKAFDDREVGGGRHDFASIERVNGRRFARAGCLCPRRAGNNNGPSQVTGAVALNSWSPPYSQREAARLKMSSKGSGSRDSGSSFRPSPSEFDCTRNWHCNRCELASAAARRLYTRLSSLTGAIAGAIESGCRGRTATAANPGLGVFLRSRSLAVPCSVFALRDDPGDRDDPIIDAKLIRGTSGSW